MLTRNDRKKLDKMLLKKDKTEKLFDNVLSNFYINIEILDYICEYSNHVYIADCSELLRDSVADGLNLYAERLKTYHQEEEND